MWTVPDSFSPFWGDCTPSDICLWWCLSYLPVWPSWWWLICLNLILGRLHPLRHLLVILIHLFTCLIVVVMTYPTLHRPGETATPLTCVCGVWGPGDSSLPSFCLSGFDSGPPLLHIAQHQGPQSQSKTITKYSTYRQCSTS